MNVYSSISRATGALAMDFWMETSLERSLEIRGMPCRGSLRMSRMKDGSLVFITTHSWRSRYSRTSLWI